MITNEQFKELLALGHELPGVEFKGPGSKGDDYLRAKVARAIIGMTNRRDGGIVIIGVEERNGNLNPSVFSQNDLRSWKNYDHVTTAFASYMNPTANFELSVCQFEEKEFIVFEVHEFVDIPTICKKGYSKAHSGGYPEVVLREGACYVRSRHKPETVELSSVELMRELLELATEKGVRKFITQAQRAGLSLSGGSQPSDQDLFEQQVNGWTSPLLDKIRSRGFWRVIIRPDIFRKEQISYDALFNLVQQSALKLHGGDFPNVMLNLPQSRRMDFVGQEIEAGQFLEAWNLYQSGQFLHYSGIIDDWLDQGSRFQPSDDWQLGKKLDIEEVVRQFTGIFVFASRLALTDAYAQDDYVRIYVDIEGLQGRRLYSISSGRVILRWDSDADKLKFPKFSYEKRLLKEDLIANPTNLALQASRDLFLRFGWDPILANLESIQSTFYRGS